MESPISRSLRCVIGNTLGASSQEHSRITVRRSAPMHLAFLSAILALTFFGAAHPVLFRFKDCVGCTLKINKELTSMLHPNLQESRQLPDDMREASAIFEYGARVQRTNQIP
jgi:hypothetical protein